MNTDHAKIKAAYEAATQFVTSNLSELCSESPFYDPDSKFEELRAMFEAVSTSRDEQRTLASYLVNSAARNYVAAHGLLRCADCHARLPT